MKIMALNIGSLPDWIYGFERFSVGVIGLGFGIGPSRRSCAGVVVCIRVCIRSS